MTVGNIINNGSGRNNIYLVLKHVQEITRSFCGSSVTQFLFTFL